MSCELIHTTCIALPRWGTIQGCIPLYNTYCSAPVHIGHGPTLLFPWASDTCLALLNTVWYLRCQPLIGTDMMLRTSVIQYLMLCMYILPVKWRPFNSRSKNPQTYQVWPSIWLNKHQQIISLNWKNLLPLTNGCLENGKEKNDENYWNNRKNKQEKCSQEDKGQNRGEKGQ